MLRRLLAIGRSAVAFLPLVVAVACASPTLPLPPPGLPTQSLGADADHVILSAECGGAEASALIVVINDNATVPNDKAVSGALASECGAWDVAVYAHKGDLLEIRQEAAALDSTARKYTVQ